MGALNFSSYSFCLEWIVMLLWIFGVALVGSGSCCFLSFSFLFLLFGIFIFASWNFAMIMIMCLGGRGMPSLSGYYDLILHIDT